MPRDREGTFEPVVVPKRKRDVSDIQDKVLSIYAKGMSQRDIADTIEDIYGFEISNETISEITDSVLEQLEEWQNRPLKRFYTFLFVDCLYVTIRKDYETKNYAVYVILGYDVDGQKDILGLWLSESESKHQWMQIFDEIKNRGVEDVLFLLHGWSKRSGGRGEGNLSQRNCPEMHCPSYPQLNQVCAK